MTIIKKKNGKKFFKPNFHCPNPLLQIDRRLLFCLLLSADDGPRVIFPEPNTYKSATQYEWLFDTDTPQDEFYFNSFYYPAVYPASLEIQYFFEGKVRESNIWKKTDLNNIPLGTEYDRIVIFFTPQPTWVFIYESCL